ncbi:hypothetical protein [Flavobacterium sp.]|uniref:hypothetical protein n=1 Tax=Flavobacterium sp. TaxID=239 RepID=UPI00286C4D51|nr:hypothetical protein [Flavobacterium sp.]
MEWLLIPFFIFSVITIYLIQQCYREQKTFQQKMHLLQNKIVECNQKSLLQNNQMQLTDELEKTLKTNKATLSDAIFHLHYDLFELLSQNNLLKQRK